MDLKGKFHSHITVMCDSDRIDELRLLCRQLYCKVTVIDLERGDRSQQDIMLTHYFHTKHGQYSSVEEIRSKLENDCVILKEHGFDAIRIKLEHESLPTNNPTADTYREIHFKCVMPSTERDAIIQRMAEFDSTIVPSSNPFEKLKDGNIVQFFNKRYYEGTVEEVDQSSVMIEDHLNTLCTVKEVKRESVVFDTNLEHDKWWA